MVCRYFNTLAEENQAIASEIQRLLTEGISLSDMVILVRTAHGCGSLLHKLMEYNIPFQMRDSLSRESFESPEVDLDSVRDFYEDKTWVLERIEQLEYDLFILGTMNPFAAINYIRRGIGYEDYLKEYADYRRIKPEELIEVLDELQESARNFKTYKEWFTYMEEYKEELIRQATENKEYKKDCITIATMHSAKGLEYHTVFIVDANEGITPHKKAALPADIEEERRLFYVAMTRAKELLYIYGAKERYNKVMPWSRFIEELKDNSKVVK
ncbi:MAG: hypothetical protein K0R00_3903 [Herbinix sp.]|nr:hypothetical protein [Herbinix sp.]